MGQCFSLPIRRGSKKVQIDSVQKTSVEGKSNAVSTSRSTGRSSRRSFRVSPRRSFRRSFLRSSPALTEECPVEPASGCLSLSDYSKASGHDASPGGDVTSTGKEQQTFGRLLAEEDRSEAMRKSAESQTSKSRATPERPPAVPLRKAYGAGHVKSSPSDRKSAGRTESPSVAQSMITKGRRSLDRMRVFPPAGNPKNLKKGRSRTDSLSRSTGSHNSSHSKESKQTLPGPVDFDFLAEKITADKAKQTSRARRDGESSGPTELNGPEIARSSSLSSKDIDEFTKSYRESAAKARARDRDAFKYLSTSETDLSITSSVGASPTVSAGAVRARRKRHSRTASSYSIPDLEQGAESPTTFAMLMKQGPESYKQEAASPSTSSPGGLIRNKSSPSFPPGGTKGVQAKAAGLPRNRSSPGSLHRADLPACEAQAEARHDVYAHSQLMSKAGKLSSSIKGSTPGRRRSADTIPEENLRNLRS